MAFAEIYDGANRTAAARIGGVGLQIVRDWVERFKDRGPNGLLDGKAGGRQPLFNDAQRQTLAAIIESGPIPAIHGVVRWRLIDLVEWLHSEFAVSLDETTVGRELKKLGYVNLTARPRHHVQNEYALEAFRKGALPPNWQGQSRSPEGHTHRNQVSGRGPDRPEKQDRPALGATRDTALGTTRPEDEPKASEAKSAYIFGAICPEHGKAAGPVLPFCNTETMTLQVAEISQAVAPRAHVVVLMDQAGWHTTIIPLPAKCPELNPVENIWQFMHENWLSNRFFTSHDNIIDHCCEAWNKLVAQPWHIMTIGRRKWANGL